jgi:hypothetical protein
MPSITLTRCPGPARPTAQAQRSQPLAIKRWTDTHSGEKIIVYGETGMGKSSLSILAPKPVFIPLDDGARKLKHPNGERPMYLPNTDTTGNEIPHTFQSVRNALNACLTLDCETVVIDTATMLEYLAEQHVLTTIPAAQGAKAVNIESYGYGKGYKHIYDTMRLPLLDCDRLVAMGKNVILVAQGTNNRISNPGGLDYLCDGPRLYNGKPSVLSMYCEWADHLLRVAYEQVSATKEKKATGTTTRVIYTKPEVYFMAKSRTVNENPVSFATPADDSIWQFVFKKG